jgi:hypothetical protein
MIFSLGQERIRGKLSRHLKDTISKGGLGKENISG